jgi:acetolactate synthase I/III small subunit
MSIQSHATHATPGHSGQTHTLSVLVENKPGVLARVAALFSRRGFNIESLAVGPTEYAEISRITLVVNVEDHPLEQVTKQLNKLVNVLKIVELESGASVHRELILVKVRADAAERHQVIATIEPFGARIVDVSVDSLVVECTGDTAKLESMVRVLEPFGVKELVQSGMIAIGRGPRSITDRTLRSVERAA